MTHHWSPRRAGPPPDLQHNAAMLRMGGGLVPQESRKLSVEVMLFDIEKDGDPRISRYMYYDFVVTKNEAYYQLQPGYLPTENYPRREKSEPVMIQGERRHPCGVPSCSANPFTRHNDLERHFKRDHELSHEEYCDYPSCSSSSPTSSTTNNNNNNRNGPSAAATTQTKKPFRLDKIQEHYRDTHSEDLLRPNYHDDDDPAKIDRFLAAQFGTGHVSLAWWRCARCKQRVVVRVDDYQCPRCKLLCEPERVAWRRRMMLSLNDGMVAERERERALLVGQGGGPQGGMVMGMQGLQGLQNGVAGGGGPGGGYVVQGGGGDMGGMMDVDGYGEDPF